MPHVFISYAKKDTRAVASALFRALSAIPGVSAWMDESLDADESWALQIQSEIDRADYVVVLLSPDVNRPVTSGGRRSFVLNEIDYAQQDNKPILPVMVERTKMPVQIAGIQYVDLTPNRGDLSPILERVIERFNLSPLVAPPGPPGAAASTRRLRPLPLLAAAVVLVAIAVGAGLLLNGQTPTATPTELPTAGSDTPAALAARYDDASGNDGWNVLLQTLDDVPMVLVPPGCFTMGRDDSPQPDERPASRQCVESPFWIDQTEVTQAQFAAQGGVRQNEDFFQGERLPVNTIFQPEAAEFCARRGGRLPTELEWEYAARGPSDWLYPWGSEPALDRVVWNGNSGGGPAVVGERDNASWVGALDMVGNVSEWTSSAYTDYPYDASHEDPNAEYFVARGGSWFLNDENAFTGSFRNGLEPRALLGDTGFRCVRPLTP